MTRRSHPPVVLHRLSAAWLLVAGTLPWAQAAPPSPAKQPAAARPALIPAPGDYHTLQRVTLRCATPGAILRLLDMTWYAAFFRESPGGKVLRLGTSLTAEQAKVLQRLAWDVVLNYPDCGQYKDYSDCGLYATSITPCGKPAFSADAPRAGGVTPMHPVSATPGAWFRYTLDGTVPTRTRGYVYCGVVSLRPGMKLSAVAFKSGMADSPVAEFSAPAKDGRGADSRLPKLVAGPPGPSRLQRASSG